MSGNVRYSRIVRGLGLVLSFQLAVACTYCPAYRKSPYDIEVPPTIPDGTIVVLESPVRSKPGKAGGQVRYDVRITNISHVPRTVKLTLEKSGFEAMSARVYPATLELGPGGTAACQLIVTVTDRVAVGGQESHLLNARVGEHLKSEQLEFITVRSRPHPFILVTEQLLDDVRKKVERCRWARRNLDAMVASAERWQPPEPRLREVRSGDDAWDGLFRNGVANTAWRVALAGKLTNNPVLLQKAAQFLRNVADPENGYPSTRWATYSSAYVHEGEFFLYVAGAYDLLYNEAILSGRDHERIDATLRLFLQVCEPWLRHGGISNWVVTPNAAAICISLLLQDMVSLQRHLYGPGGFQDQITLGVMGDGWFYECTANYSYLVAEYYGYAAHACRNWGFDLFHLRMPARYPRKLGELPNGYLGMVFDLWGPPGSNTRGLKDLYDGAIRLMNEKGYVVASNDSGEIAPGNIYELAYYHYRDPAYAWAISKSDRTGWPALLYGVEPLPQVKDPRERSAKADNIGIAALRSQTSGRTADEQIQAFIKWGTHGGWHGHFDRASLLALYRYGKSFYHPTVGWFGYSSPMYKSWVQTSVSHNMVVVDKYQQEPVESELLLFAAGEMMQVCAVQTKARWHQIPKWDPRNPEPKVEDAMIVYGPEAEPVLQRRLLVVTDDYVVVADYLAGGREHTFDWLIHPVGFQSMTAAGKRFLKHTAHADDDPAGSYKHILDCTWYEVSAPVVARFRDNGLHLDIHMLWPERMEMMLGTYPVYRRMFEKTIHYVIRGDNKTLQEEDFYTGLLKKRDLDISVADISSLSIDAWEQADTNWGGPKAIALGDPRFVTRDGDTIYLADLLSTTDSFPSHISIGRDFAGGNIQLVGQRYPKGVMLKLDRQHKCLTLDLTGLDAVRFRAVVGVDYPVGKEQDTRRTLLARTAGRRAQYLAVIEPHAGQRRIKRAVGESTSRCRVELADGRIQTVTLENFEGDGRDMVVRMTETRDENVIREETLPRK